MPDDFAELTRQGFVCGERRGNRTYYKLRFRRGGRQTVRYLGGTDCAAIVKQELAHLQADSRALRDLKARTKSANKTLRDTKRELEPVLQAHGFVFHGMAIRRPRGRKHEMTTTSNS